MPLMLADEPTTQDDMDLLMNLDEDDDQIWSKVADDQEELLNYASSGRNQVL